VPKEMKVMNKSIYIYEETGEQWKNLLKLEGESDKLCNSKDELIEIVNKDSNKIGLIIGKENGKPVITIINQGTESKEIKKLLESSMEYIYKTINPLIKFEKTSEYKIETLRAETETVPLNKSMIPLFMVLEAGMLGMFLIVIMIFQEKQEGTVQAYRVSSGGAMMYISSKLFVVTFFSLLYAVVIAIFTLGFSFNYLYFILLTILGSLVLTLIGLATSVFFKNLSEYLFIMMALMTLISLPAVSYFSPSFSPAFFVWMPTYPFMFGLREIFFPTGKLPILSDVMLTLLIECVVLFLISYVVVKFKLMKEGK
jgi:hypothetical protein